MIGRAALGGLLATIAVSVGAPVVPAAVTSPAPPLFVQTTSNAEVQGDRVKRIAARLIAQVPTLHSPALPQSWRFDVVGARNEDQDKGGLSFEDLVCLQAAFLPLTSPERICVNVDYATHSSDDELAWALGHEMGHWLRSLGLPDVLPRSAIRESLEVVRRAALEQLFTGGLYRVVGELPASRHEESEADRISIGLMARAGFDVRAVPAMFGRYLGKDLEPEILSDHPSSWSRYQAARAAVVLEAGHAGAKRAREDKAWSEAA